MLKTITVREILRDIKAAGYVEVRQKGRRHKKFIHPTGKFIVIPSIDCKTFAPGTAHNIYRLLGRKEDDSRTGSSLRRSADRRYAV